MLVEGVYRRKHVRVLGDFRSDGAKSHLKVGPYSAYILDGRVN